MAGKAKNKYQYKRLLEKLEGIEGRGTELISVYITPGYELNQVVRQLREERGSAENIKSKSTRKNVISALGRIINFLQKYSMKQKKAPENGMAIFAGNVTGEEGSTDIKLYWVEPPDPIDIRTYRCDQEFLLEPLREALEPKETVGLLALDTKEATIATLRGKHVDIAKKLTSGVWGKHSRGGQSSQRFERLREIAVHDFMKRIAEVANREFSSFPDLRAILVGGPGPTKDKFLKKDLLRNEIGEKVAAVLDMGYSDEQGIKELVNKAKDVLSDLDVVKEKSLVQDFLSEVVSDDGLATYGEKQIRRHLKNGAVETLLISEDLELTRAVVKCEACDHEFQETISDASDYEEGISERPCPECGERMLNLIEVKDEVRELCELADQTGAEVEFISLETEEGRQLSAAFKGLGGLLRYKLAEKV